MFEIIGWSGVVIYLVAYALLAIGWVRADRINYHALNAAGALCLVVFSYHMSDRPNLVVNLVWIFIASASILRIIVVGKKS